MNDELEITIDIETIPDERDTVRQYFTQKVEPPGTMKRQETILKWTAEKRDAAVDSEIRDLALNPWFAQIICIGVKMNDTPTEMIVENRSAADFCVERDILIRLYETLRRMTAQSSRLPTYIGHHVLYDLRTIAARSVVNKVTPTVRLPYDAKPWSDRIYDTANFLNDKPINMAQLCLALGIDGKGDFDGSMVYDAYRRGEIDKICAYCAGDVDRTRMIANILRGRS